MQPLEYKTEIETVGFYSDDPTNPVTMGQDGVKLSIVNHGFEDSWVESQTTIRIGGHLFSFSTIKEILEHVNKYHTALKAISED